MKVNIKIILEKISKNHFNYLYVIGKGGFGRVNKFFYKGLES